MLISYNQNYEKISMGLLSYIPDLKNISHLQEELDSYIENGDKKLYLWRDEHTENIVAIIGIGCDDSVLLVRHLSVSPSFRNEGIIYKMLDKLQSLYPELMINGTLDTAPFLSKWVQKNIEGYTETDS
ncbi:N-acetyltransferase [Jeotgalibaca sp. MA1X17-3]|uniref:N-acetyltransferase n=1 Tax=Jeotgalibaca sp. MA1X17-3 TaxID=2908211 RepID=UPI001F1ECADE|nr:N-acetyltransferase [Jeotgalibaca sp. MA1X17-3]UJF14852.1 N-acetyltransferase [Jeotgalibaca sp. MA1X17-3]